MYMYMYMHMYMHMQYSRSSSRQTYNDEKDLDLQIDQTDIADAHHEEEQLHDDGQRCNGDHKPSRAVRVRRYEAGVRLVHGLSQLRIARHVTDGYSCRYQRWQRSNL